MNWKENDKAVHRKAAQYVRMSTEHQRYSTENQSDAIALYAEERGYRIIQTYSDAGKSGLRIQGRDGLTQLLEDIQAGKTDFKTVLVYDISRWGRFQDADESAYYEYICKRAGIAVEYCAEQFENDGSPVSTIVKGVKRAMAGVLDFSMDTRIAGFLRCSTGIRAWRSGQRFGCMATKRKPPDLWVGLYYDDDLVHYQLWLHIDKWFQHLNLS